MDAPDDSATEFSTISVPDVPTLMSAANVPAESVSLAHVAVPVVVTVTPVMALNV